MEAPRRYETSRGCVTLRREQQDDEPFLEGLFRSHAERPLRAAGLADAAIGTMLQFQYRSQSSTYRALYPDAAYWIIECAGEAVGRLIEHDEGDKVYFVDFALLPERQAKGLGTAFIELVANQWAERGRGARVEVRVGNTPSLKLCAKLGFRQIEGASTGYINLVRPLEVARASRASAGGA